MKLHLLNLVGALVLGACVLACDVQLPVSSPPSAPKRPLPERANARPGNASAASPTILVRISREATWLCVTLTARRFTVYYADGPTAATFWFSMGG